MPSRVVTDSQRQLTLALDASLPEIYRSARDCVAAGVYKRGLKRVASDLDVSPGNLSVALSDDPARKLGLDEAERYTQTTGDKTWIYYLVAKYLGDEGAARDHALTEVQAMLASLPEKLAAAGLTVGSRKGR
jgi:hypothetical protein